MRAGCPNSRESRAGFPPPQASSVVALAGSSHAPNFPLDAQLSLCGSGILVVYAVFTGCSALSQRCGDRGLGLRRPVLRFRCLSAPDWPGAALWSLRVLLREFDPWVSRSHRFNRRRGDGGVPPPAEGAVTLRIRTGFPLGLPCVSVPWVLVPYAPRSYADSWKDARPPFHARCDPAGYSSAAPRPASHR